MRPLLSLVIFSLVLNPALDARQPLPAPSSQNPATVHQAEPQQPPAPAPAPPQQNPAPVPAQQEPTTQYQQNPDQEEQPAPLGQPPPVDQVDRFIQPYLQMGDFSGCILVARYARILTRKCYGGANYELRVVNTLNTRFHIASITKAFTAAGIVILEQQGKLHTGDSLSRYIPNFPSGDKITIKDLLEHSSGIPSYYDIPEYDAIKYKSVNFDDLIAIMRKQPLLFEPGKKSAYSDTNYAFLAYIIEKASGMPYEQFLNDEIFVPFGMKNTGTFSDTTLIPQRASGYQPWIDDPPSGQPLSPIRHLRLRNAPFYDKTITTGSGSLYSTIDDLYLFYQGLQSKRIFDIESLEYPYGWGTREFKGRKFLEQSGRDPGFVARIAAFIDYNVVVIVLSNVEVGADAPIAEGLQTIAFGGEPPLPPPERPAIQETAQSYKIYEGRYQIAPNSIMDVRVNGDHLFLRGPGGNYLPLEPTGRGSFFYRQMYVSMAFHRDDNGTVDSIVWGGNYVCKKIPGPPAPWN
jgi:CubicO group peptidase (beta-lactamase class C family)